MQNARQSPQQSRFAESRNALEQDVAAGQEADQDAIDHILLADDDLADLLADTIQSRYSLLQLAFGHAFHGIAERGWGVSPLEFNRRQVEAEMLPGESFLWEHKARSGLLGDGMASPRFIEPPPSLT